ncbi:GTP-binding protein Obg/CgtA [Rickenella mellea]|uniref:GTP-binding protein Obg/CgtA n=1 Tax=Rickenella mellea TaxID=50990 RepID=A0A4Y7QJZ1_9AGAM|nr:GTP-binding protein Obg/CgtA [Rickenella mellea]
MLRCHGRKSEVLLNAARLRHVRKYNKDVAVLSKEIRDDYELEESRRRQRKTDWKRRQRGQTFLDHLTMTVQAGKGGDGCVAFHREKFVAYGPPSGGNGGRGADVFIVPTPHLTTLSSVPKHVRGLAGGHGRGSWMNGRNAQPTIIKVPLGTVVREVKTDDSSRAFDTYGLDEDQLKGLTLSERVKKMRERRWVHYPDAEDDNLQRDAFKEAEKILYRQEREKRAELRSRKRSLLNLDLDREYNSSSDHPSYISQPGYLVATGGTGGIGNPAFITTDNRSPKFATRGTDGERVTLSLELKILADVGLVGFPNAGKSTLLRALTGGRAKTEVADYEFTTLNPVVGVVRIGVDGGLLEGGDEGGRVIEDTKIEEERFAGMMERGELAEALTRNQLPPTEASAGGSSSFMTMHNLQEEFRFTIADNPGLISQASENVGLGHSFLRSIERSLALVYVVDLSGPSPEQELRILRDELEKYKPGLSAKARMVIANKADLLGGGVEAGEEKARQKLQRLERFVEKEMRSVHAVQKSAAVERTVKDAGVVLEVGKVLDVVAISAKFSENLRKPLQLLRRYVGEARCLRNPEI